MTRRTGRFATIALATISLVAVASWAVLVWRLQAGVAAFLTDASARDLATAGPPRIGWHLRPTVELGPVVYDAPGLRASAPAVRVAMDPWAPSVLLLAADGAEIRVAHAAAPALTAALRARIVSDATGGFARADATLAGTAPSGRAIDAALAATAAPTGLAWTLDLTALPSRLHATGTVDGQALTLARATLEDAPDVVMEGRVALDPSGRPLGAGVIRAPGPGPILAAIRASARAGPGVATLSPGTERTLGALLAVGASFATGDLAIPIALRDGLVTVLGVPLARLDLRLDLKLEPRLGPRLGLPSRPASVLRERPVAE